MKNYPLARPQPWCTINILDTPVQPSAMSLRQLLNDFFSAHEKRAFRMAMLSLQDQDAALDTVQDVMLKFVEKYPKTPQNQWPKLFYRMLHHRIIDYHRQHQRQAGLFGWFARGFRPGDGDKRHSSPQWVENMPAEDRHQPQAVLENQEFGEHIEHALCELPLRQRQAFLLRCWYGMSVAETAQVMGCSGGSVKTHTSRAIHTLQTRLKGLREAQPEATRTETEI